MTRYALWKLKEVTDMDELYHNCRWCKWFDTETSTCVNPQVFEAQGISLYPFWEDGKLELAIEEGFGTPNFDWLRQTLMENGLSKKKTEAVMEDFYSEFDDMKTQWLLSLDKSVSDALNAFENTLDTRTEIANPDDFYCKFFW